MVEKKNLKFDFIIIKPVFKLSLFNQIPFNTSTAFVHSNEDGLIALNKEVGVLSHPNAKGDMSKALLVAEFDLKEECYRWCDAEGEQRMVWLVNRLDAPTSGLILLATSLELKNALRKSFESHLVEKEYFAVVRGRPRVKKGVWSGMIRSHLSQSKTPSQSSFAKTIYEVDVCSESMPKLSRLKLNPITGRTHQLRIHCADHHLPIVGDQTYGDFKLNRSIKRLTKVSRLMLHCSALKVSYSLKGQEKQFSVKVPLPESFKTLIS